MEFKFVRTFSFLRTICFAVLGGLTGFSLGREVIPTIAFALGFVLLSSVVLTLLGWSLALFSPQPRKLHGQRAIGYAMAKGSLMMIPFTVLAAAAELYLGWSAVQSFSSAAVMATGAAVGAEMVKLGGGRVTSFTTPMLWSFLLSGAWIVASSLALSVWRG